jgi:L-lactate dehydrogenase complex protein LldG
MIVSANAERFSAELTALGGHVYIAHDPTQARDYIEKLIVDRGGPVRMATRAAVTRLGLPPMPFEGPLSDVKIGVTQADYALADTGTLVVFSEAGEGRTLSLLPPLHVAVLEESRILAGLDELMEREPAFPERSSAMIFITGPSRTADIERTLTVGVHGPGELHVVVLSGTSLRSEPDS